jgi:hypothetical protein
MTKRTAPVPATIQPRSGVNQECRGQIDRSDRNIHHHQDDGPGNEAAQMLEVSKHLKFAVRAVLRSLGGRAEHRRTQFRLGLDGDPHQYETPYHVQEDVGDDCATDDDREHDQRVLASARVHAVRQLEQVDRHREQKDIDHEREDRRVEYVAATRSQTFA